jgi:hypothetical protein
MSGDENTQSVLRAALDAATGAAEHGPGDMVLGRARSGGRAYHRAVGAAMAVLKPSVPDRPLREAVAEGLARAGVRAATRRGPRA